MLFSIPRPSPSCVSASPEASLECASACPRAPTRHVKAKAGAEAVRADHCRCTRVKCLQASHGKHAIVYGRSRTDSIKKVQVSPAVLVAKGAGVPSEPAHVGPSGAVIYGRLAEAGPLRGRAPLRRRTVTVEPVCQCVAASQGCSQEQQPVARRRGPHRCPESRCSDPGLGAHRGLM